MSTTLSLPDLLDPATFRDGPPRDQLRALPDQRYFRAWSEKEQMHFWAIASVRVALRRLKVEP